MGFNLEKIYEEEYDAALGNGGLGRLAACFLDSFATLNLPAWGYGIRYNYGIFRQFIRDGYQCEAPDFWLDKGNPWEIERLDLNYPIRFYGHVRRTREHNKDLHFWEGGQIIMARGYDNPIPGYNTFNTINLRLWRSLPNNEFDFSSFNQGDYFRALEERQRAEYITSVLYPNDSTYAGKELRLKQQYLLVSASILDAIRRFMMKKNRDWKDWPEKVMCQLNDTHPAMAIVELLRTLLDIE
jgi:starch phosphorylase